MSREVETIETVIRGLIGDELYLKFVEAFAGRRLFVSTKTNPDMKISEVIGEEAATSIASVYAPDYVKVPLSREFRCKVYWEQGLSTGQIATMIGITEGAVSRIIQRLGLQRFKRNRPPPAPDNENRKARLIKGAGCE